MCTHRKGPHPQTYLQHPLQSIAVEPLQEYSCISHTVLIYKLDRYSLQG